MRKLQRAGVVIIRGRGKGGHVLASCNGNQATIPIHGDADIGINFLNKVCKQLGLDVKKVL